MSRLTELREHYAWKLNKLVEDYDVATRYMETGEIREYNATCKLVGDTLDVLQELQHYKDLEEQGRLIDWRKTSEEKPDSTRHLIVADGEYISHYGYYLKPKDKWFTNWKCEEEISAPMFWADMPEPPKESLHSECGTKGE